MTTTSINVHYDGDEIRAKVFPAKDADDFDLFILEIGDASIYVRADHLHAFKSQMGHAIKALRVVSTR